MAGKVSIILVDAFMPCHPPPCMRPAHSPVTWPKQLRCSAQQREVCKLMQSQVHASACKHGPEHEACRRLPEVVDLCEGHLVQQLQYRWGSTTGLATSVVRQGPHCIRYLVLSYIIHPSSKRICATAPP